MAGLLYFLAFCKYFRSHGSRTRTGDAMIFRHVPFYTVERR